VDTTKVPLLAAANTFTTNQTVNGTVTATSFSGNGASLTGVTAANSSELGGLAPSAYAQLAANNTFTGAQTINNAVTITSAGGGNGRRYPSAQPRERHRRAQRRRGTSQGMYGSNGATSGVSGGCVRHVFVDAGYGVYGTGGTGVFGTDGGVAGGTGVYGQDTSGSGYGVYGTGATGVYGTDNGVLGGIGAYGGDTSGNGYGVYGSGGAVGVYGVGIGTGVSGTGYDGVAGYTASTSGSGNGVFGQANGGSGTQPPYYAGVWGDVGGTAGESIAVVGTAGENFGALFENNGSNYTSLIAAELRGVVEQRAGS
jgi:hypothetical protein